MKTIIKTAALIILFCLPVLAHAQVNPGCDPAVDPSCVPIDGGLGFLIAAGIGYGIKRVRGNEKNKIGL